MSSTQSRQPSGVPGGGRFASGKTDEATVRLGEPIWLKDRPETTPGGEDLLARYGAKPEDNREEK